MKLREVQRKDLTKINTWRNDKELIKTLEAPFRYINEEIDEIWYENYLKNRNNQVRCAILEKEEIVGLISLLDIDWINRKAEIHIMIGEKSAQGKGIGKLAMKEMLNHAFENMNLDRVGLEVLENNTIAKNLYEKLGFVQEGIKRKAYLQKGEYQNIIVMGMLKNEFRGE